MVLKFKDKLTLSCFPKQIWSQGILVSLESKLFLLNYYLLSSEKWLRKMTGSPFLNKETFLDFVWKMSSKVNIMRDHLIWLWVELWSTFRDPICNA